MDNPVAQSTLTVPDQRRKKIGLWGEITLALLPTGITLLVLLGVEVFSNQRLLFASLASSAFLIYLDPRHGTNRVRNLIFSQVTASLAGAAAYSLLGPGYWSAAAAMLVVVFAMIWLDALHPPAVATALAFAFRSDDAGNLLLFEFALVLLVVLIGLQKASIWLLERRGE